MTPLLGMTHCFKCYDRLIKKKVNDNGHRMDSEINMNTILCNECLW